jgi:copper chaperone CopZ
MKGNANTAADVERLLQSIDGIGSTAVNTLTGSVLINYDTHKVPCEHILDKLRAKGFMDAAKPVHNDEFIQTAVSRAGTVLSKALLGLVLEKAFEGSALSLITVLL